MVLALLAGLALASPQVLTLEVGLVRVTAHRPGSEQTWVIPAEKKQSSGGLCSTVTTAGATAMGAGLLAPLASALCATPPVGTAQKRLESSPDIYVRLTSGGLRLRSYTVQKTLSNTFHWRVAVPVDGIPKRGLELEVLNDDGGPDEDVREVIGQARFQADKLLAAASSGSVITVQDGGIEKLELTVEDTPIPVQHKTQALDVRKGNVAVEGVSVLAGEVVEVQARGDYRWLGKVVQAIGGPGAGTRTYPDAAKVPLGAATVRIGKHGWVALAAVAPCGALIAPEGLVFVGINNLDAAKAQGDLNFDVTVRPATAAEWQSQKASISCAPPAPLADDAGDLRAFTERVVQTLRANPNLAAGVLANAHPTGKGATLRSIEIDPSSTTSTRVLITIDWRGGFVGGVYATRVAWEFNTRRHIAASLAGDSASIKVSPEYLKKLDAYFAQMFASVK